MKSVSRDLVGASIIGLLVLIAGRLISDLVMWNEFAANPDLIIPSDAAAMIASLTQSSFPLTASMIAFSLLRYHFKLTWLALPAMVGVAMIFVPVFIAIWLLSDFTGIDFLFDSVWFHPGEIVAGAIALTAMALVFWFIVLRFLRTSRVSVSDPNNV